MEKSNNYLAFVLPIGVLNIQTGKTMYDWSVYGHNDVPHEPHMSLYYCSGGFLLYGMKNSFNVGDEILLRGNDSLRKLKDTTVEHILTCEKDKLIEELLEIGYDYRELRAFAKKRYKRKLMTSYSIKGIEQIHK